MDRLRQVLIVTNSITESEIDKIKDAFTPVYAPKLNIKVNLVHVIPRLPTCYFNIPSMGLLIEKYYDEARASLQHVGDELQVHNDDQWLISGKIRTEVLRLANKLGNCFILAGGHHIQELQHSLYFKGINQMGLISTLNRLEAL